MLERVGVLLGDEGAQPLADERAEEGGTELALDAANPSVPFAADDDEPASGCEGAAEPSGGGAAEDVDDDVVGPGAVREVVTGVVAGVVGAESGGGLLLEGSGNGGDFGAGGFGCLDDDAAYGSGGADDQDAFAGLDLAVVADGLESCERCLGQDRGLVEGEAGGLVGHLGGRRGDVLGVGAAGGAVDLVADREAGHLGPDGLDASGVAHAGDAYVWGSYASAEPHEVRLSGHEVQGATVDAGGDDLDEHLVVTDIRAVDVVEPER